MRRLVLFLALALIAGALLVRATRNDRDQAAA